MAREGIEPPAPASSGQRSTGELSSRQVVEVGFEPTAVQKDSASTARRIQPFCYSTLMPIALHSVRNETTGSTVNGGTETS